MSAQTKTLLLVSLLTLPAAARAEAAAEAKKPPEARAAPSRPGRILEKQAPCKPAADGELIRLDFDGAPTQDLVREVGRVLCKNFIVDDRVARTPVVVLSAADIRADALWPTFLSVLAMSDLTLLNRQGYFAVVPAVDATRDPVPTYGPKDSVPDEERMVTKVIEVKDKDLNAVANFLNIFKSGKGQVHPWGPGGVLVMTDFASSIVRLEWILGQMGRPPAK